MSFPEKQKSIPILFEYFKNKQANKQTSNKTETRKCYYWTPGSLSQEIEMYNVLGQNTLASSKFN